MFAITWWRIGDGRGRGESYELRAVHLRARYRSLFRHYFPREVLVTERVRNAPSVIGLVSLIFHCARKKEQQVKSGHDARH